MEIVSADSFARLKANSNNSAAFIIFKSFGIFKNSVAHCFIQKLSTAGDIIILALL